MKLTKKDEVNNEVFIMNAELNANDNLSQDTELTDFDKYTQELPDGSRQIILSDGTVVVLRRLTGGDIRHISQNKNEGIDQTMRLITIVCAKWGSNNGVSLAQLDKVDIADIELLSTVVASFRTRRNPK